MTSKPVHEAVLAIYEAIESGAGAIEVEASVGSALARHVGAELGGLTFDLVRLAAVLCERGRLELSDSILGVCAQVARRLERAADDCSTELGRTGPSSKWLGPSMRDAKPATIGDRPPAGSVPVAQLLATQSRPRR